MSKLKSVGAWLLERFGLKDARAFASSLSGEERARIRATLTTAWQRREAAEALYASSSVEAGRLAKESVESARAGVLALKTAGFTLSRRAERVSSRLDDIARDLESNGDAVPTAVRLLSALEVEVSPGTLSPGELSRLRVRRAVEAFVLVCGLVAVCGVAYEARYGVRIRSSNELGPAWSADRAIDGDANTDWVADGPGAWIEIDFRHKVEIKRLHVMNGQFFSDRAAKEIRVDVYDGDVVAEEMRATFAHDAEPVTLDTGGVRTNRIRLTILSHFGIGPAISEIRWE
ncbi:MAG TPA: discoidin domain-containing protein [Polyangiaceae bacterium]|jgi:hypothetical protein|nr:discoidin domain-containing protein [Polyangiaceae bacterium]